jgi:hypothetical protein
MLIEYSKAASIIKAIPDPIKAPMMMIIMLKHCPLMQISKSLLGSGHSSSLEAHNKPYAIGEVQNGRVSTVNSVSVGSLQSLKHVLSLRFD